MSVHITTKGPGRHLVTVWIKKPDATLVRDRKIVANMTRAQAKAWGSERERKLIDGHGEPEAKASPAFDAFSKEWLETYPKARGTAATTNAARLNHVKTHLLPFFASMPLDKIDRRSLDKFAGLMATKTKGKPNEERVRKDGTGVKPLSPSTVQAVLLTLRRILRTAVEYGDLTTLPPFPAIRVPERTFAFYDAGEAERLIDAAHGPQEKAILTFALHTGARAGELLALRRGDVDLVRGLVTFSRSATRGITREATKSGRVRSVPLSQGLVGALRTMFAARTIQSLDGDDLVFSHDDGSALDLDALHRMLARAQRRAGLRVIRLHDLRHSFASILAMAGAPMQRVQSWLGHTTPTMTQRYAHLTPGGGREHLEGAFSAPETVKSQPTPQPTARRPKR
jgi:integrase